MKLDIPFYENKGDRCLQVCMKTAIKYFLDKDYTLEELDEKTGRKDPYWTYTFQIIPFLLELDLDVKIYGKEEPTKITDIEAYLVEKYGEKADHFLKYTDVPVVNEILKIVNETDCMEQKILTVDEIQESIEQEKLVVILIDYNKLIGKEENYQGHFVIVTGFDTENFYYHNSGPKNAEANIKISKEKLLDAWNATGTDNDIVIIGK